MLHFPQKRPARQTSARATAKRSLSTSHPQAKQRAPLAAAPSYGARWLSFAAGVLLSAALPTPLAHAESTAAPLAWTPTLPPAMPLDRDYSATAAAREFARRRWAAFAGVGGSLASCGWMAQPGCDPWGFRSAGGLEYRPLDWISWSGALRGGASSARPRGKHHFAAAALEARAYLGTRSRWDPFVAASVGYGVHWLAQTTRPARAQGAPLAGASAGIGWFLSEQSRAEVALGIEQDLPWGRSTCLRECPLGRSGILDGGEPTWMLNLRIAGLFGPRL